MREKNCFIPLVFAVGFCFGFLIVVNFQASEVTQERILVLHNVSEKSPPLAWRSEEVDPNILSYNKKAIKGRLESDYLKEKVYVSCAVFVSRHESAYRVMATWGQRCNHLQFYGTEKDFEGVPRPLYAPLVLFPATTTWHLLCHALFHLDVSHKWFLLAPHDAHVIPENLRWLLSQKNHDDPHYLGHMAFRWTQLYNTRDAPYVLSSGSIRLLKKYFLSLLQCIEANKFDHNEDFVLGQSLAKVGVSAKDTRDSMGRDRFHIFTPLQLMSPGNEDVLLKYSKKSVYRPVQGHRCCSDTSVSFRVPKDSAAFLYSYLLYDVKVFNTFGGLGNNLSKVYTPSDEVWKGFVRENLGLDYNLSRVSSSVYYSLWELYDPPEEFLSSLRAKYQLQIKKFL